MTTAKIKGKMPMGSAWTAIPLKISNACAV
jgi:hypothetical protein